MNISKSVQNKTTVILKIELLPAELKPYLDRAVKRISQEVKVDGFRPGHVPYDVLKAKVGDMEIHQEAARLVVDDTLPTAVQREAVTFVGRPDVAIETLAPGNPLVYTATFATMPTVQLKAYQTIRVAKPPSSVDETKFTKTVEQLRKLRATTTVVDRPAQHGDQVVIDFDITLAGVPVEGGQGKQVRVVLGEQQFIPGFETALVGAKAGETKTFTVIFPQDYAVKHLAGKLCDVTAKVQTVSVVTLPELNDAFAKQLNFKSATELQDHVRANIQHELEQKAEQEFEAAIMKAIIQQAEFDPIPTLMLEYELDRMMDELRQEVQDQGGKMDDYLKHIKKTEADLRQTWRAHAEQRVKGSLVIKAVAEQEQITVSEDDITTEVTKQKTVYKAAPDILKKIDSIEYRAYTRTVLRNQRALAKLRQSAGQAKTS